MLSFTVCTPPRVACIGPSTWFSTSSLVCRIAPGPSGPALGKISLGLAASSAVLGPLLDNYHSAFGSLVYTHPVHFANFVTTELWVPPLFAFAGIAIGIGTLLVDSRYPPPVPQPSFPRTFFVIACFSGLYYLRWVCDQPKGV